MINSPDTDINLAAYLDRIGYTGPTEPSLAVLTALVAHHMTTIPFEAIDVLLDQGVDLSPAAIDHKMLTQHRGGYCFEHTSLMRRALQTLGFTTEQHLARVWVGGRPEKDCPRPATHTSLKVEADGRLWLVDVGFGGFLPNRPLAWQPLTSQNTDYGQFRLAETRDGYLLESWHRDHWSALYEILDFNWQAADLKVANHYTATHPASHFRSGLMVALTGPSQRITLAGNRLRYAPIDGKHQDERLNASGLAKTLETVFGLKVEPGWRPLLEKVATDTKAG